MTDPVKENLQFIAAAAEIVSRRARILPFKPPFRTSAQDELEDAEQALEVALQKVREAMAAIDEKKSQFNQQWRGWN